MQRVAGSKECEGSPGSQMVADSKECEGSPGSRMVAGSKECEGSPLSLIGDGWLLTELHRRRWELNGDGGSLIAMMGAQWWRFVLIMELNGDCCSSATVAYNFKTLRSACLFLALLLSIEYRYSTEQKASEGLSTWHSFMVYTWQTILVHVSKYPMHVSKTTKFSHMGWPWLIYIYIYIMV